MAYHCGGTNTATRDRQLLLLGQSRTNHPHEPAVARRVVQENRPSRMGVVRAMARSDHWRWVSTPRWVRTS